MTYLVRMLILGASVALLAACGSEKESDACETTALLAHGILPASGSTVENEDVVHQFAVQGTTALLSGFVFTVVEGHTAGPATSDLNFQVTSSAEGLIYTGNPISWNNAPADVRLQQVSTFSDAEGCTYTLEDLLFDYSVSEPTG